MFMLMYCYIQRFMSIEGYVNLTIKDFLLYYNFKPDRNRNRINSKVIATLLSMVDNEFIKYIGCYSNGGLSSITDISCDMQFTIQVINYDEKWNPNQHFTKILYNEIDALRNNNVKSFDKVLCLYLNIKKHMSGNDGISATHIAYPSENTLAKECGCSVRTIKNYTDILVSIGMLYVRNYGSYLSMKKGKETILNSNNVYALEEQYLNESAKESLRSYLKNNYNYIDGFFGFCDNLPEHEPNNSVEAIESKPNYSVLVSQADLNVSESTMNINSVEAETIDNAWGEPDLLEHDYSINDILDMPCTNDIKAESNNEPLKANNQKEYNEFSSNISINNPIKVVSIKKSPSNENKIPTDILIQHEAEKLFIKYSDRNELSLFILDLSEKFPGLDDYEKYWNYEKKMQKIISP